MTYEQDISRWKRHHRVIGDLPLLLIIPSLSLYLFGDNPAASLPEFSGAMVFGIIFWVAGIHRLFQPLPPETDAGNAGKKLRRNLWSILFLLAALLTLTVGVAGLVKFFRP